MVIKLIKYIKEFKKYAVITPVLVIFEVILDVLIPTLMAFLIDEGVNRGDMDAIMKYGTILLIAAVISMLLGILAGRFAALSSSGLTRNLRRAMFNKVQTYSFGNIDKFSSSSIITRLTTDLTYVNMSFQMMLRIAIRSPLMIIFAMIMASRLNSKLASIYVFVVPFLAVVFYLIIRYVHPIFERVFKVYDKLNKVVQENLAGIRVVKSFVREDYEKEKFGAVSDKIYRDFVRADKIIAFNAPVMQLTVNTCIMLLFWIGGGLIIKGDMTTGNLVSFFTYNTQMLMNLMMLSMIFVTMIISKPPAERIMEILSEESDIVNPENPQYDVADGSIDFKNVDFSFIKDKNKLVIKNADFKIESGDVVGIIGGTGSGKSSLVQLIPRLYDTTGGAVMVGGKDVRSYDIDSLRNSVAMILQKNVLFSGTVKENLRWGNKDASDEELVRVCKLAQAHNFIDEMPDKYDTMIERGGTNLSGGQKQRLCIARALLKHPKIIIFDDSTSAVDTKTDAQLRKAMSEEMPGVTKIIIAQRVSSIENADKIIVLDEGKINGMGTHAELLESNTIYREVYMSQQQAVIE